MRLLLLAGPQRPPHFLSRRSVKVILLKRNGMGHRAEIVIDVLPTRRVNLVLFVVLHQDRWAETQLAVCLRLHRFRNVGNGIESLEVATRHIGCVAVL